jgi:hypothetical protein
MCGLFDMRAIPTIAKTLSAALFVTGGCARAPKRETDPGAVRAEILALENQWATAIERQDVAAFERLAAEDFRFIKDDGRALNPGAVYRCAKPQPGERGVGGSG